MSKLISSFYDDFEIMEINKALAYQNKWEIGSEGGGAGAGMMTVRNFPLTPRGGTIQVSNKVIEVQDSNVYGQMNHRIENRTADCRMSWKAQLTADAHTRVENYATWVAAACDNPSTWLWAVGIYRDDVQMYDNAGTNWTSFVPSSGNCDFYEVISQGGVLTLKINGASYGPYTPITGFVDDRPNYIEVGQDAPASDWGHVISYIDCMSVERYESRMGNVAKVFVGR